MKKLKCFIVWTYGTVKQYTQVLLEKDSIFLFPIYPFASLEMSVAAGDKGTREMAEFLPYSMEAKQNDNGGFRDREKLVHLLWLSSGVSDGGSILLCGCCNKQVNTYRTV